MEYVDKERLINKTSVLMLTTSFPVTPGMVSGSFIHRLVCHLTQWARITVITPAPADDEATHDDDRYSLKCFRYGPRKWQILAHQPGGIPVALSRNRRMLLLLPFFIISEFVYCWKYAWESDLIHANWSINGVIAGLVGLVTKIPVVTTLRGTDIHKAQSSWIHKNLLKVCLVLSDRVVTVSDSIMGYVAHEFPNYHQRLELIPNGVDPSLTSLPLPNMESKKFRILTVGNLVPNKGIHLIIEALQILNNPTIVLQVVGDGIEKDRLRLKANKAGIGKSINFAGAIAPDSVVEEYKEADVLILPSYSEGRPNVILEGMAAGIPIIASDIDGVRELIENGTRGLLFKKGDSQHLARQIACMRNDFKSRFRYAESAREFIIENRLLWTETAKRYAELYASILPQNVTKCVG